MNYVFLIMGILGIYLLLAGCVAATVTVYRRCFKKKPRRRRPVVKKTTTMETINLTNEVKKLIDEMIVFEVSKKIQRVRLVNEKYDIKRLDKDAEEIMNVIFKGINPLLWNTDIFMTTEYLMGFITTRVSSTLLEASIEYNNNRG